MKGGFPRFKSINRVKSLHYLQFGFSLNTGKKKLKVSPFGEINIKLHRSVEGTIKTLTLKRESSGKWYAIFTVEAETNPIQNNSGSQVGLDLGLINFAVLSDGTTVKNPRHLRKYEDILKKKQQDLSFKKKGGKNRIKAKRKLAILHERVRNTRKDFLHKLSRQLVHSHSLIALEDLASQEMAEKRFGKSINDVGWSIFTNILSYKAEEAGCEVLFVNPKNTSKDCSRCGVEVSKELHERQHNCPSCGLSIDRDLNAAINILNRCLKAKLSDRQETKFPGATAGIAGSNACEDGIKVSSVKQEAHAFMRG